MAMGDWSHRCGSTTPIGELVKPMELKLQPVMTRLHPREIAEAIELGGKIWKQSPLVRLFFCIGLYAIKTGLIPWDLHSIQALLEQKTILEQEKAAERNERLPRAADPAQGPGLAGGLQANKNVRRPRIDPFHLILEAISHSFKRKRCPQFALARSRKGG